MNPKFSRALSRTPDPEVVDRPEPKIVGKIGVAIASIVGAIVLAVTAAGGSYAYLSQSAVAAPATAVTSGTATLAVTSALTLPATKMYPGSTLYGTATVANTGDVPLALRVTGLTPPATSTDFTRSLVVTVGVATTTAQCTSGTTPVAWTGTFASATTASLGSSLALSASGILCVAVTLPPTAPSGSQSQSGVSVAVLIDGTQA